MSADLDLSSKLRSLVRDLKVKDALERIVAKEEETLQRRRSDPIFKGLENAPPYWDIGEVGVDWRIVRQLVYEGVLEALGGKHKYYVMKDREAVKKVLYEYKEYEKLAEERPTPAVETTGLPPDLFDVIEGYEDLKEFIKMSLRASEPVHCLMVGAPGTAKSLFLMEIERLGGRFITAGTSTKVGIRDIIYEELPRILIIDELDKIADPKDLSALLTWMESGRIVVAKSGLRDERRGRGWVFAAANTLKGLPPELIDRFQVFHIKPYTRDQFIRVVMGFLTRRRGVAADLARYIAERVADYSVSVREAIRIAALAKTREEVDKIVGIIQRYRA